MRDAFLGPRVFKQDPARHLEAFVKASPLAHVSPEAPDFFVLHGANDSLVDVRQARTFVERLKSESKATVTFAEFPGAQHAFEVFGSIRSHHVIKAVERWLMHHHALWLREGSDDSSEGQTSASR
jgi:acetyl esterase/lipase